MRSARGVLASPKCAMLKVVDQMTTSATIRAEAAANKKAPKGAIQYVESKAKNTSKKAAMKKKAKKG